MTLPQGWVEVTVGELSDLVTSGSRGWAKFYSGTGAAFIRVQNVRRRNVQLDFEDVQHVTPPPGAEGERTKLRADDIVVTITADLGRIGLFREDVDAFVNQHVALVRLLETSPAAYLSAYLTCDDAQGQMGLMDRGVTRAGLGLDDIKGVRVPLPPLAEQRRIVAKLDALTARLARARAELDRVPVLAANLRKETLRNVFGQETLTVPVGELITDIRYGTAKKCEYAGGAVPVLRIPNVQGGRIDLGDMKSADFDAKELAKLTLRQGDILVIRSNGSLDLVGRSAIVDDSAAGMLFAGYLIRMRVEPTKCLPEYLHHFLQSPAARATITMAAKSTSGVNNVNAQQLQALAVPLPDITTQRSLVGQIEQSFARADRLEAEAARARALLDRLESALLARAFRGELVPQDPNDEPAHALLNRIRTQRAAAPKAKRGRKAKVAA